MTVNTAPENSFTPIIEHFITPTLVAFGAWLETHSTELDPAETNVIHTAAHEALLLNASVKLNRVLLLELHAARRCGELTRETDAMCFAQFVERTQQSEFAKHLRRRYPALDERLQQALNRQCSAIQTLVARFITDRAALARLLGGPAGRLVELALGQGDLHAGGQTVARLSLDGGKVMYKPHSLRIDGKLDAFLGSVFGNNENRIRIPEVLEHKDYGWAAFAAHRYCESEAELQTFYKGLGHWLAILRLLGGTDIHLENLIAVGPVPVVVDVESLFAPPPKIIVSGYGDAFDQAEALISSSVLRTGIVPLRGPAIGFDGVDLSAAGSLPDQQPPVHAPIIAGDGTLDAHLEVIDVDMAQAQNHPSPRPDVSRYWDHISDGFLEATARLRQLDAQGELTAMLNQFNDCRVREIRRPTQAYVEIGRMLWHPASLHDEAKAIERARDLLKRNAAIAPAAPSSRTEIMSEIDDLRYGDVPIFVSHLTQARISTVADDWRAMRADVEELTIRSALVATDLNQRMRYREEERSGLLSKARNPHADNLEVRRRKLAADAVERLLRLAVHGKDGTITWITPEIDRTGWTVQPVLPDLYFGLGGITAALAGYQHEVQCSRATHVPGLESALHGALRVLVTMEADKPETIGGFSGYGSQIWTWLSIHDSLQQSEALIHAVERAEALEQEGFAGDERLDIIDGTAGAIVPLLGLADTSGDSRWLKLAACAATRLEEAARVDDQGACWQTFGLEDPIGGFSHGATGVAWALARLALSEAGNKAERVRWGKLAEAAFQFQESLYDSSTGNWLDVRPSEGGESYPTWCHGSIGIGLAACDLYARTRKSRYLDTMRRAATRACNQWGYGHTLCHGDMSLREFLVRAAALDPAGCPADPVAATAQIVSAIEEHHGMVGGLTRAAFTPGMMTGLAGVIHGLCRMHPDCDLASPLLLECRSSSVESTSKLDDMALITESAPG